MSAAALCYNRAMKLLKGAVLGGLILSAWGVFAWVVMPWNHSGVKLYFSEREITAASVGGAYFPSRPGLSESPIETMAQNFGGNLLAAFLATLMLLQLGPRSLIEKVLFLLTAAALMWAGRAAVEMTWFGQPVYMAGGELIDLLIGWTLAGSALAWIVHPRAE